ncbi:Holliday junction branch migration protein RuvA [Pasteurella atlantica]|uniref:Holliday junction branch migration protein RuvA n=3 Tax=Pasteurellaceae TaxID=712 RepID=A0AAW8CNN7_9PAST|nr:Holliday junction branch migration protein RuvA [Pasteurella atlantica]MBR0573109.1 Holliday junction branch migration protein RuvA [Pasteurella atlantica]MDP8032835.1 Holliday junction branch migration protein RuvA [Pasteurella atlantica]MDP8034659.1 Holliday junction branch migration protein RuvA [Pasteurella atlantica]MDP8036609.1 Holliday junction branch migration protein RuvA [Pasteurella atlantica]MDP8039034.1 Holliday junction branch migration protein RuvA [Pasteurella atlantica]
MIGRLQGKIIEKSPPEIVLDVQGVGYELLLPMTSFYNLPKVGEETTLFTHLSIREDAHLLFGFSEKIDRTLFRDLIKTNGVGPKLALAILSAMSVYDFATAVENEEVTKLTKIPGIGKKTAERLLVELKGKFKSMAQTEFFMQQSSQEMTAINKPSPTGEAKEALIALGYKATEIEKMLKKVSQQDLTSEQIIREALKKSL